MNESVKIFEYKVIDSTNNEAKRMLEKDIETPVLIVAGHQTAGRGRQGKSFYSPADTGLYMTLVINPGCPMENGVRLTTIASCAVAMAIEKVTGVTVGIKWVNDVYIDDKKACGILCEAVNDYEKKILKYAIIGIGINITTECFPEDVTKLAGSLFSKNSSTDINGIRKQLINEITERILKLTENIDDTSYLNYYRKKSNVIGHDIYYIENDEKRYAKAVDVDEFGGLIILENGVKKTLNSGEISIRRV